MSKNDAQPKCGDILDRFPCRKCGAKAPIECPDYAANRKLSERISSGDISQEVVEAVARGIGAANLKCLPSEVDPSEWLDEANAAVTALLRALGE